MSVVGAVMLVFVVSLALSMPIAVALLLSAMTAAVINPVLTCDAMFAFRTLATGLDSFVLIAIPLFILSGNIMAQGGISDKIFTFFSYFLGRFPGGLPCAVVVSCLFYGAITGSGPATVAAIGTMAIPFLIQLGYKKDFVTALVTVAGGLGVIIPPSIPFVVYGQASNTSVSDLFIAGILPGILIGVFLMIAAVRYCLKHGEDKELLAAKHNELRQMGFLNLLKDCFWALLCPVIILGGIYSGLATPTEAACISVFYAFFVSLFYYKTLKLKDMPPILVESVRSLVAMLIVAASATVFARVLTMIQAPQTIAAVITSVFSSKIAILLIINLFLLVVGMLMDAVSAILICTPLFLPIVQSFGMDPVHFGIMITVNLAIGFVTPPVGVNLFVASSMTGIPVMDLAKKCVVFLLYFLVALMIITFVPEVSLLLVRG